MMNRKLFLIAPCLLLAFAAACPGVPVQQGAAGPELGKPFPIKAAETITLDSGNLSVTFEKVTGDSRCPVNVTCIWEGDATVVLKVKKPKGDASSVEVHTSGRFGPEASFENYRIKLQDLKPQPRAETPTDQKAYIATLVVTAAQTR
jgi:hypothetical protein